VLADVLELTDEIGEIQSLISGYRERRKLRTKWYITIVTRLFMT